MVNSHALFFMTKALKDKLFTWYLNTNIVLLSLAAILMAPYAIFGFDLIGYLRTRF